MNPSGVSKSPTPEPVQTRRRYSVDGIRRLAGLCEDLSDSKLETGYDVVTVQNIGLGKGGDVGL